MGKKPDINVKKIAQIEVLIKEGQFGKEISRKLPICESIVSRLRKKMSKNISLSPKKKGKSGRNRITSKRDDSILLREALTNRRATSTMLQKIMNDAEVNISSRTVRRRLCENVVKARRPRKKQKLTKVMSTKRLDWAKNYINWKETDWENVISCIVLLLGQYYVFPSLRFEYSKIFILPFLHPGRFQRRINYPVQ